MRTVWASKGVQSPFTSAVRSSASVSEPLPKPVVSLAGRDNSADATYGLYLLRRTTSTALPDRSHPSAVQGWAEALTAAQLEVVHDSLVEVAHGHSLLVVAILPHVSSRNGSRIASLDMRRAEACCHILLRHGLHSGHRRGSYSFDLAGRSSDWVSLGQACCNRGGLSLYAVV